MRNRSTIWLMLAVIALQGTGLLRALHLAVKHAPPSRHGGTESARSSVEAGFNLLSSQDSGHGCDHHQHNPAPCPVCQVLASVKVVFATPSAGLSPSLPPTFRIGMLEGFPLPQISLLTLGPRAPPTSA